MAAKTLSYAVPLFVPSKYEINRSLGHESNILL